MTCDACGVKILGGDEFCPLCGERLESGGRLPPRNQYPDLSRVVRQYNFVRRLLIFVSVLMCGLCVMINLLVSASFLWSMIVLAVTLYCWLIIPPLLRKGRNFAAQTVLQVILTSALVVALDMIIGYKGWSVSYVVPGLLTAGIASVALIMILNRTNRTQYVVYQVILGLFGFIPLVLYLFDLANNLVMVLITAGLAFSSLAGTIIFGDRSIKSEFKRRFHI